MVRAWLVASRISGAPEIRADLAALEGRYPSETIYRWLAGLARVLEGTTAWILANAPGDGATDALIEDARSGLAVLRGNFAKIVSGEDRALFMARLGELQDLGVERTLGERLITLRFLPQLLEIVEVARRAGTDELKTAKAFYAVSERFGTARLREAVRDGGRARPVGAPLCPGAERRRAARAARAGAGRAGRTTAARASARWTRWRRSTRGRCAPTAS